MQYVSHIRLQHIAMQLHMVFVQTEMQRTCMTAHNHVHIQTTQLTPKDVHELPKPLESDVLSKRILKLSN